MVRIKSKSKKRHRNGKKRLSSALLRLCEYLKELRKDMDLNLREAAKLTNLTPGYLSKVESGQIKSINIETLVQLAGIYKISVHNILHESGFFKNGKGKHYDEHGLPDLATYLRIKYHLPQAAARDIKILSDFIEEKYKGYS